MNGFEEFDVRPQARFTFFDEFGNFDPEQQAVLPDFNEYIHLTVTDQWEVYEHFYGQGKNSEYVRYLDGFTKVLDKHIDTGQTGQLWVLPYLLEGKECQRIDALGNCTVHETDLLLEEIGKSLDENTPELDHSSPTTKVENSESSEHLAQSKSEGSWYSNLLNKLKG